MSTKSSQPALDDISKRIVELLQEDGRRPYAEIAKLDFATWTWTKGGSMHEETIRDRKIKLGSWLNAVLYLCPGAKDVVEFIDGEAGLLASVNDGTSQPE